MDKDLEIYVRYMAYKQLKDKFLEILDSTPVARFSSSKLFKLLTASYGALCKQVDENISTSNKDDVITFLNKQHEREKVRVYNSYLATAYERYSTCITNLDRPSKLKVDKHLTQIVKEVKKDLLNV